MRSVSADASDRTCQVLMDELDGHRPLADGGGAAFGRAGAHVAGGKDAGHARLEQVVAAGGVAGEDEAVGGARDRVAEPLRARLRAQEEEEGGEREPLAALQRDLFELALRSVEGGDLAAVADRDAVPVELV